MKILNSTSGFYLTEVQETFSDAEALVQIFKDYVFPKNLRNCLDMCSTSQKTLNDERIVLSPVPRIESGIFFLCDSSHTKVGAISFTFSDHGSTSTSYITKVKAVIKKSERGRGCFTEMFTLISWFFNQFLQADQAQISIVDTAPQVSRKLDERTVETLNQRDAPEATVPFNSVSDRKINVTDYAGSFTSSEWVPFSLSVNDETVAVPTKGIGRF